MQRGSDSTPGGWFDVDELFDFNHSPPGHRVATPGACDGDTSSTIEVDSIMPRNETGDLPVRFLE
jgi:hypothetical protein